MLPTYKNITVQTKAYNFFAYIYRTLLLIILSISIFSCAPKYTRLVENYLNRLTIIEAKIRVHLDDLYEKKLLLNQKLDKNKIKILDEVIKAHEHALNYISSMKKRGSLTNEEYRKLLEFHLDLLSTYQLASLFEGGNYIQNGLPTPLLVPQEEGNSAPFQMEKIKALITSKLFLQAKKLHALMLPDVTTLKEVEEMREIAQSINRGLTTEIEAKIEEAESLITFQKIQEAYDFFKEILHTYRDAWPHEELKVKVENYLSTLAHDLSDVSMEQKAGIYDHNKVTFDEAVLIYENAQNTRNLFEALKKFESLFGTTFDREAQSYSKKTKDKIAQELRKEAAAIFLEARKMENTSKKKEELLKALELLRSINRDYPENSVRQKVEQNIDAVLKEIRAIDPYFEE